MTVRLSRNPTLVLIAGVAALIVAQASLNVRLREQNSAFVLPPQSQDGQWNPRIFEAFSFGHLPTAVDWLWLRALQEEDLFKVPPGVHPPSFYLFDLATELDPAFFEAYWAAGNYLSVVRDDYAGAERLLTKGTAFVQKRLPDYPESFRAQHWQRAWQLYSILGYLYIFELDDFPKGAKALETGATLPGAPDYLQRLAERLKTPEGRYEVGLRLVDQMIQQVSVGPGNAPAKAKLQQKRTQLLLGLFLQQMNESFSRYLNTLPQYRSSTSIEPQKMQRFWAAFLKETKLQPIDPLGGSLSVSQDGSIITTSPRLKVFGF